MERIAVRAELEQNATTERPGRTVRRSPLRVGAAGEPAEREADRVADRVMRALRDRETGAELSEGPSRIRRSTAPAGAIGPAGGDLSAEVAGRLQAARGGGRALDPSIRRPMEQAFGADFGRIRLHEGSAVATLNDELGASAFTLGRDIFVREPLQPSRASDQHLLAHELAHTVQQRGNDGGPAARTIRRKIGFEFEVGSWGVEYIDTATTQQLSGLTPLADDDIDDGQLDKDMVLYAGRGFNLKPDEASDGTWHMEFVIEPPVPETSKGRSSLESTMKDVRALNDRMIAAGAAPPLTRTSWPVGRLWGHPLGFAEDRILLTPWKKVEGEPQLTAGIRLDQLGAMMTKMASVGLVGETQAEATARTTGAYYMGGKGDSALVAQSPGQVRNLFATFPGKKLHSPDTASEELISFLALVRTYLVKASAAMAYAKSIAPIMARTDLGAMFTKLPEAIYYRSYPKEFAELALHVSGMTGQGGQPFFAGTSTYTDPTEWLAVQAALSRTQWLEDLPHGIDRVTVKHFPDRTVAGLLFGLGKLGGKTESVGKGKSTVAEAPIFELRRMAGYIDHRLWSTLALELFDYLVALNRLKSPTFKGRKTAAKSANL